MKKPNFKISPALLIFISLIGYVGYFVSCTQKDQVLNTTPPPVNTTTLTSITATTAPSIDGFIEAAWDNAPKLYATPTVPDPGNGLFTGYIGEEYPVTLRSMYDANYIYFLAEITDNSQTNIPSPWYFNPALNVTGKTGWQKEPSSRSYDVNGLLSRVGFGEDRLAMLWNVDSSTPKFITETCYASCHVFSPYMDYSKNPAVYSSNANSGNHYTNSASEKIDMWWGRLGYASKDASLKFMDDNYQDWAGGPAITNLTGGNANGRHVDGIYPNGTASSTWPNRPNYTTSPVQGEVNNTQNLKLDGTGASVSVPLWVLISGTKTGFITAADTLGGAALKVIAVSSAGVLTLSDNSTIDPTVGTDYQRTGDAISGPTAAKAIPGFLAYPLLNERADIVMAAVYSASGWTVEYKR
ncbi:MAG TPA: hypothetical protein DGG95_16230, partial [Cytophagales bacterium]|nr:hypothetical protein [Cytophagales bacterium]